MTGKISCFTSLTKTASGNVTFSNNGKGEIYGEGTTGNSSLCMTDVLYVESLKNNPFSRSQLCDTSQNIVFEPIALFMMK